MTILESDSKVEWLPNPHHTQVYTTSNLPPAELITSVHSFVFQEDELLLIKNRKRGWEIPGGHIDKGENTLDALIREVQEETEVTVEVKRILFIREIKLLGEKEKSYKYPYPISYQVFFLSEIKVISSFQETEEVIERRFMNPEDLEEIPWIQVHRKLYDYALKNNNLF